MEDKKNAGQFNPFTINFSQAIQRIGERSATDDNALGYYLPVFINTPLPHSQPPRGNYWRYNGNSAMKLIPDDDFGLPHSGRSRLLIAWMLCKLYQQYNVGKKSGIERNKLNEQARMIFEGTIQELLAELGYEGTTGGENGSITQIKEHLLAIISTQYTWPHSPHLQNVFGSRDKFLFTRNDKIDWRKSRWDEVQSYIEMSSEFLHLVRSKTDGFTPFPVDLRAMSALRDSPMGMDLYCWLTRKMYRILTHNRRAESFDRGNERRHRFMVSWKALHPQFGAGYKRQVDFANRAKDQIKKIEQLWKDRIYEDSNGLTYHGLHVEFPRGRIELFPSPTHIPRDEPKGDFYRVINA